MSERPTHPQAPPPQASSATGPAVQRTGGWDAAAPPRLDGASRPGAQSGRASDGRAGGQSLATRAARFRNGAPFLVERATLYDPHPLDPLPIVEVKTLPRPRRLLPVALTLLGVVIVVGLAAGVLFVRNADGPRDSEQAQRPPQPSAPGSPHARAERGPHDGIAYDLTRRPNDAITGAWRLSKELAAQPQRAPTPTPPASVAVAPPPPEAPRRFLPRRLSLPRFISPQREAAVPQPPPRAPLDEPHVPKAVIEEAPKAVVQEAPKAVIEEGPKAVVEAAPVEPRISDREPPVPLQQVAPKTAERTGGNVVARVGREADGADGEETRSRRRGAMPIRTKEEAEDGGAAAKASRSGRLSRRALHARLREMRKAAREAQDRDRFLLRDAGDIPKGFTYSGPQGQRP